MQEGAVLSLPLTWILTPSCTNKDCCRNVIHVKVS